MPTGVILDIDGTLLLSNNAHAQAWVAAYAACGYTIPFERIQPLIGMGGDKLVASLSPHFSASDGDPGADTQHQLEEQRARIFRERFAATLQPAPGARALLQHMRAYGLKLVVATSAKQDELKILLRAAKIHDLIEGTTTSSEVKQSKPAPDVVAVAMRTLQMEPRDVVMVGDTPYDIASAGKTGVGTIAMRCGGHTDAELEGAIAIYDDPADLLARFDQSPLTTSVH